MTTKQKIQRLNEATARGEAALGGSSGAAAAALAEIHAALEELNNGVGPEWAEDLERGLTVAHYLQAQVSRLEEAAVRDIPACRACGSAELLLADSCIIAGLYVRTSKAAVPFTMIACSRCGDIRLYSPNVADLRDARTQLGEPAFRVVTVPGGDRGPFR
jgi:hypothetical protein